MNILNIAAYRFVRLEQLPELRLEMRTRCQARGLKGTVLLAEEGINLFLAGAEAEIESFLCALRGDARFAAIEIKRSW